MNILYYGFSGSGSDVFWGIFFFILAAIIVTISIIITIIDGEISSFFIGCAIAAIFALLGLAEYLDSRIPIIKATINDEVSWQEIYNKYQFKLQEGEIYTFKVKDTTNEEWEAFLKEHCNE